MNRRKFLSSLGITAVMPTALFAKTEQQDTAARTTSKEQKLNILKEATERVTIIDGGVYYSFDPKKYKVEIDDKEIRIGGATWPVENFDPDAIILGKLPDSWDLLCDGRALDVNGVEYRERK